jgi:putative nucleotidyltransferase with HDIG domain
MTKLLVVDDEEFIQETICDFFSHRGYETCGVSTGEEALSVIEKERPHLVLLDVTLEPGGLNGFEVLEKIKIMDKTVKVIIITGKAKDPESIGKAEMLGVNDYLFKPLNYEKLEKEALPKIGAQLFEDFRREADDNRRLYEELKRGTIQTITALAKALDARDRYTFGHSERVADYSVGITEIMGFPKEERDLMRIAGLLHDVGKIGISDEVLKKPAFLTKHEQNEINSHPTKGANILEPIPRLREISDVVLHHHERYDGSGYPDGLTASDEPIKDKSPNMSNESFSELAPWILAVSDAYDAMTSPRPYRDARSHEAAMEELVRCAGSQFHPGAVEAFQEYCRKYEKKFDFFKSSINYKDYPILLIGEDREALQEIKRKLGNDLEIMIAGGVEEALEIVQSNSKIYLTVVFERVSNILNKEVINTIGSKFPNTKIALTSLEEIGNYDQIMNKCQIMRYILNPSNPFVLKMEILKGLEEVMSSMDEE